MNPSVQYHNLPPPENIGKLIEYLINQSIGEIVKRYHPALYPIEKHLGIIMSPDYLYYFTKHLIQSSSSLATRTEVEEVTSYKSIAISKGYEDACLIVYKKDALMINRRDLILKHIIQPKEKNKALQSLKISQNTFTFLTIKRYVIIPCGEKKGKSVYALDKSVCELIADKIDNGDRYAQHCRFTYQTHISNNQLGVPFGTALAAVQDAIFKFYGSGVKFVFISSLNN